MFFAIFRVFFTNFAQNFNICILLSTMIMHYAL